MQLFNSLLIAVLASTIGASPLHKSNEFLFQPVHPVDPEFSIKVPSELFIEFCQNENFGEPCDGGYVSPGLCYYAPFPGVTAVQPAQDISGCTLYRSSNCNVSEGDLPNVAWPGIPNLTSEGFNDEVNSFICY